MNKLRWAMIITLFLLSIVLYSIFWAAMWYFQVSGPGAIILVFAFVFFMVFFQWAIGPSIIKAITKMKECHDEEILSMVNELAHLSNIPTPKTYIVNNPAPNAFAFGRTQKSSAIALHTGLIQMLDKNEIRGVIAHELGHIKHRDVVVMTLASALPALLYYVVFFGTIFASSRNERGGVNYIGAWLGGMLAQFVAMLIVLYLSRVREYYADEHSAKITKRPEWLISALQKISAGNRAIFSSRTGAGLKVNANLKAFYIEDPRMEKKRRGPGLHELLLTHPLTHKRIKALEELKYKI